jgi:hypothetical protein
MEWFDKKEVIEVINRINCGESLEKFPKYCNNRSIVLQALEYDVFNYKYISNQLKEDEMVLYTFLKKSLTYTGGTIYYLPENEPLFHFIDKKILDNKDVVIKSIYINCNIFPFISERLKKDKEVVICAMEASPLCLRHADIIFQNDREFLQKLENSDYIKQYIKNHKFNSSWYVEKLDYLNQYKEEDLLLDIISNGDLERKKIKKF